MPRGAIVVPRDTLLDESDGENDSSDHDEPMGLPRHETDEARENNSNGETGGGNEGDGNRNTAAANNQPPPRPNASAGTLKAGGNIRHTVDQMIAHRKLDENAQQDLHRYAKASTPEREIMDFSLNLEVRQETQKVASAITTSLIHPEVEKNAKTHTAAVFFAPNLTYYSSPRGGSRAGMLPKTVFKALQANHIAHLPPASDKAGVDKVLSLIGGFFTSYRSEVKSILEKRKLGEPEMDLGSLVARATKGTTLKITAQHYGRFALLSRYMESYKAAENKNCKFWDYADQALKDLRTEKGNDQKSIDKYFRKAIRKDEEKWSKAVGDLHETTELEEWQRVAQKEGGLLSNK
ncbi:hypothetical protein FRC09_018624 [Ceratobasidium sp. 395]|nr:hypothetical protein FRC09_018624 [Ceratobasidium sp. 395]